MSERKQTTSEKQKWTPRPHLPLGETHTVAEIEAALKNIKGFSDSSSDSNLLTLSEDETELNPFTPRRLKLDSIRSALKVLTESETIKTTMCEESTILKHVNIKNVNLYIKYENLQYTGSVKARGVAYALLQHSSRMGNSPVVTASASNFATAFCHYSVIYRIPITLIMPVTTPISIIVKCEQYKNAKVIVEGDTLADSIILALTMTEKQDITYIGEDDINVLIGQATLGLEISRQVPHPDMVLVPVGSGGLIAGVASAMKQIYSAIKIIGIESESRPFKNVMQTGKLQNPAKIHSGLQDEFVSSFIGRNAFAIAYLLIDELVEVKEEWVAAAMVRLLEHEKYVVEAAGAAGLAALLFSQVEALRTCHTPQKVVLILPDSNLDPVTMSKYIQLGLSTEFRLVEFSIPNSNNAENIMDLVNKLKTSKICVHKVVQHVTNISILCEVKDKNQAKRLETYLKKLYQMRWSSFHRFFQLI